MSFIQQAVLAKKAALADAINTPMARLGERCVEAWPNADALDQILHEAIGTIPHCHLLYTWDINGIEISSMIQANGADPSWRGRDLSQRPYLKNHLPFKGVMLSSAYMSQYVPRQCITALQAVSKDNNLLGFIAADFALTDLIHDVRLNPPEVHWQQFRGDPAVRGTVFMQERVPSLLDKHIDDVLDLIHRLMSHHGVFHSKIHFSSGRCSLWLFDDPYNYRLHSVDEIIDPDICLAYPEGPYPKNAKISPDQIRQVLDEFKSLRFADETIYLRSSSINIMNGLVGLTFSCDGSHYMSADDFLKKDLSFWLGALNIQAEPVQSAPGQIM
ncbi:MAG: PDC sensor domain-containing protein [Sulfuricaulis sp.]